MSWVEKSFEPSIRPRTWFLVFIELCVSKGTSLFRAVIIDIRPIEPVLLEECCHNSGGRIRTCDLRVMGPTSYQTALPRGQLIATVILTSTSTYVKPVNEGYICSRIFAASCSILPSSYL